MSFTMRALWKCWYGTMLEYVYSIPNAGSTIPNCRVLLFTAARFSNLSIRSFIIHNTPFDIDILSNSNHATLPEQIRIGGCRESLPYHPFTYLLRING